MRARKKRSSHSLLTPTGMRRRVILACAVLAAAGVMLLARPQPTTDYLGIGLGLFAATCWASYILLNRTVGERFTGIEGTAAAGAVSALVYVPIGAVALIAHPPTAVALACGVPRTRIERLAREETSVTADTALRLARYFGTTAEFGEPLPELTAAGSPATPGGSQCL